MPSHTQSMPGHESNGIPHSESHEDPSVVEPKQAPADESGGPSEEPPVDEHAADAGEFLAHRKRISDKADRYLERQMDTAVREMGMRARTNTLVQGYFYLVAVGLLAMVVYMVWAKQADLRFSSDVSALSVFRASFPFIVVFLSTALCVSLALLIQGRSGTHFNTSLDQISRLRREGTSANSRSMALTQILEETLANARQAFAMQLWISRVLFVVGIFLVFGFILSLFGNNPLVSGGSIATAVLALGAAALFNPQRQIGSDLANVTQLEAILGGYIRQASLLEEHLYQVMEAHADSGHPEEASDVIMTGVDRLGKVLNAAVKGIDNQVHGADRISDREAWLIRMISGEHAKTAAEGEPTRA
jgi:hypothetical protein